MFVIWAAQEFSYWISWVHYGWDWWLPPNLALCLLASGAALPIWLPLIGAEGWHRPLSDAAVFAFSGLVAPAGLFVMHTIRGDRMFYVPTIDTDLWLPGGMSSAAYLAFYLPGCAVAVGALAGALYWLLAGRPGSSARRYK